MRVMVLVKTDANSEAGKAATPELLQAMMAYNEQLVNAGIMISGEGLRPSSQGVRVHFSGSQRTVTEGPFPRQRNWSPASGSGKSSPCSTRLNG